MQTDNFLFILFLAVFWVVIQVCLVRVVHVIRLNLLSTLDDSGKEQPHILSWDCQPAPFDLAGCPDGQLLVPGQKASNEILTGRLSRNLCKKHIYLRFLWQFCYLKQYWEGKKLVVRRFFVKLKIILYFNR